MDYEKWEGIVRQAVYHAIGVDPCGSREKLQANDETTQERHRVVQAWKDLCVAMNRQEGMTSREAAEAMNEHSDRHKDAREAFPKAIRKGTSTIDSNQLGYILRKHRDAPVSDIGTLEQTDIKRHGAGVWVVRCP